MIGKLTNTVIYTPASLKAATAGQDRSASQMASPASSGATAGETTVSISTAARQQQAADAAKQAVQRDAAPVVDEKDTPANASAQSSDSDDVLDITKEKAESFAYGALGMDHPDEVTSNTDEYYTAGQVLSALGTVATVLLAIA